MIAFSLTPSSLLSKNGASLRNPYLSYIGWFYFCLFLLEQFMNRGWKKKALAKGRTSCMTRKKIIAKRACRRFLTKQIAQIEVMLNNEP